MVTSDLWRQRIQFKFIQL